MAEKPLRVFSVENKHIIIATVSAFKSCGVFLQIWIKSKNTMSRRESTCIALFCVFARSLVSYIVIFSTGRSQEFTHRHRNTHSQRDRHTHQIDKLTVLHTHQSSRDTKSLTFSLLGNHTHDHVSGPTD